MKGIYFVGKQILCDTHKPQLNQRFFAARVAAAVAYPLDRDAELARNGTAPVLNARSFAVKICRALEGCYVEPCIVKAAHPLPIMQDEIFAPILYVVEFDELEQAIGWHNDVPQGLSSAIFTSGLVAGETFLSARGSDEGECDGPETEIDQSAAERRGVVVLALRRRLRDQSDLPIREPDAAIERTRLRCARFWIREQQLRRTALQQEIAERRSHYLREALAHEHDGCVAHTAEHPVESLCYLEPAAAQVDSANS